MADDSTRLNKFIAQHFRLGRRAADELIAAGKVTLNGERPTLGARVFIGDTVAVQGRVVTATPSDETGHFTYIALNKPVGYVCSRRQQGNAPTIYSLLPAEYQHLKSVGRLDKDSSGLLLLTNDGDLAHRFTHPSFKKIKQYKVTLDQPLQPLHQQMISDIGVNLPDGRSQLQLERLHDDDSMAWRVTMHEGRNRQIRRTFAALGYTVTALHRTRFGNLTLDDLGGKQLAVINKDRLT